LPDEELEGFQKNLRGLSREIVDIEYRIDQMTANVNTISEYKRKYSIYEEKISALNKVQGEMDVIKAEIDDLR